MIDKKTTTKVQRMRILESNSITIEIQLILPDALMFIQLDFINNYIKWQKLFYFRNVWSLFLTSIQVLKLT